MRIRTVAARVIGAAAAAAILAAGLNAQTPPRPSASGNNAAIVPFRIQVPDAVLRDLKSRLERARFADEFPDAGWDYGTNLNYIQSLMTYWRDTLRLARAGAAAESLQPVQDEHRRPRHPFHPSEIERSRRDAAAAPERVAELAGRVRQGHRAAHQPVEVEWGHVPTTPSMSWCRRCRDTASRTSRGSAGTTPSAWRRSGRR